MSDELLMIEGGALWKEGKAIFRQLYLTIHATEILGMIFDHILEQKYLLSILKGEEMLDAGTVYLNQQNVGTGDVKHFRQSVSVIERTGKLIDSLSIPVNVLLFAPFVKKYVVNEKHYRLQLQRIAKQLRIDIPLEKTTAELTSKEKIVVELVKAYVEQKKLVVFSGVIGSLQNDDAQEIISLVARLKQSGMTFLIMESPEDHRYDWIDRLVVIRNGKTQWIFTSDDMNRNHIYTALLGGQRNRRDQRAVSLKVDPVAAHYPALQFVGIHTEILRKIDFSVEKGGIFRVCFLDKVSFTHFVDLLKGIRKPLSGHILLQNRPYAIQNSHQAVGKGLCFIEESPYETMNIHGLSVLDHFCLPLSRKIPHLWLKRRYINNIRQRINQMLGGDYAKARPQELSPENLLKIAYLRWLIYAPPVVICLNPFTELDIHLHRTTEEMIDMLRDRGIAVVILTFNMVDTYRRGTETIYIRSGQVMNRNQLHEYLYGEQQRFDADDGNVN